MCIISLKILVLFTYIDFTIHQRAAAHIRKSPDLGSEHKGRGERGEGRAPLPSGRGACGAWLGMQAVATCPGHRRTACMLLTPGARSPVASPVRCPLLAAPFHGRTRNRPLHRAEASAFDCCLSGFSVGMTRQRSLVSHGRSLNGRQHRTGPASRRPAFWFRPLVASDHDCARCARPLFPQVSPTRRECKNSVC